MAEVQAGALDVEGAAAASVPHKVTYKDLFLRFVWMGWVAFGGPTAHIALFQKVTTERSLAPWIPSCGVPHSSRGHFLACRFEIPFAISSFVAQSH